MKSNDRILELTLEKAGYVAILFGREPSSGRWHAAAQTIAGDKVEAQGATFNEALRGLAFRSAR